MKTAFKTLFLVLLLTLSFSGFSYAQGADNSPDDSNIIQSANSNSSYNATPPDSEYGDENSSYSMNLESSVGAYSSSSSPPSLLPATYDLRTLGRVTPPKNQSPLGTCWIFAALASLESCLLPGENWDFSENNIKNTLSSSYPWGYDLAPGSGGYDEFALTYFTRWSGPVNESDDPYNTTSGISPENLTVVKHIQNCFFLPGRTTSLDNDLIKTAIVNYGGVVCGILWNNDYYNASAASYCFLNGIPEAGHSICLVGWDDNYDKSNFIITPPGNGAFIVKNSYGTDFGDQGYFYISYYDTKLGYGYGNYFPTNLVYMNAESPSNYKQIYQYDPFGMCGNTKASSVGCSTAAFMNVFHATSNNPLQAASFYTLAPNTTYNLYAIVNNITTEVGHGVLEYAGYYTINFTQLIPLIAGQEFKIIVNITSPGCLEPIAIEYNDGWADKATSNPGESFIKYNGIWTDLTDPIFSDYPDANVCLKAFTAFAGNLTLNIEPSNLQPVVGELLKFTINAANNGPDNSLGTQVNYILPPGLDMTSYQAGMGDYNHVTGIWTIGELEVGKTISLIIYGLVKSPGDYLNVATITSLTYNYNPSNSTSFILHAVNIIVNPQINIKKSSLAQITMFNFEGAGIHAAAGSINSLVAGTEENGFLSTPLLILAILLICGILIILYFYKM